MCNNWIRICNTIIWKETLENIRESSFIIPINVLLVILLQCYISFNIINSGSIDFNSKKILINNLIIYSQLMSIPLFGNNLLFRSILEEKRSHSICVLLTLGIPPMLIWIGKILSTSIIAYISSLFSVLCYILILYFYSGFNPVTFYICVLSFFVIPLISIGILCLISTIYWSLHNAHIVGFAYPLISFFGIWILSFNLNIKRPSIFMLIVLILFGIALISTSLLLVRCIPKENIIKA